MIYRQYTAYTKTKIKTDALDLSMSVNTGCAINDAGKAYCWGRGDYCGNGINGDTDQETLLR